MVMKAVRVEVYILVDGLPSTNDVMKQMAECVDAFFEPRQMEIKLLHEEEVYADLVPEANA